MIGVINNGISLLSVPHFYPLIVKSAVILMPVWLEARSKGTRECRRQA